MKTVITFHEGDSLTLYRSYEKTNKGKKVIRGYEWLHKAGAFCFRSIDEDEIKSFEQRPLTPRDLKQLEKF